jgi:hypothetical protein
MTVNPDGSRGGACRWRCNVPSISGSLRQDPWALRPERASGWKRHADCPRAIPAFSIDRQSMTRRPKSPQVGCPSGALRQSLHQRALALRVWRAPAYPLFKRGRDDPRQAALPLPSRMTHVWTDFTFRLLPLQRGEEGDPSRSDGVDEGRPCYQCTP